MKKIALITPLKDEMENIAMFLNSLSEQSIQIFSLVILENDSTDGSKEYLDKISEVNNIVNFNVLNLQFSDKSYRVDVKYSTIIKKGFDYLSTKKYFTNLDYIGILDSDCFPEKDYYEKLINFMKLDEKIGIASGVIFTHEGERHKANINWVRGGCRVWTIDCFNECGFLVEPSPDVISVALAHLNGYSTKTCKDAITISREVGEKGDYSFYGKSAYYRGHTLIYLLAQFLFYSVYKRDTRRAIKYLKGYVSSFIKLKKRISHKKLRRYFNMYLINKIIKKYN